MQIGTRFAWRMFFAGLVTASVVGIYAFTYAGLEEAEREHGDLRVIIRQGLDLNTLTGEYAMRPSERARDQWRASHASLVRRLGGLSFASVDYQTGVDRARRGGAQALALFNQLVAFSLASESGDPGVQAQHHDVAPRLAAQIYRQVGTLVATADYLKRIQDSRVRLLRRMEKGVVLVALITLLYTVVTSARWARRHVVAPVQHLREAVQAVGAGDLRRSIPVSSDDEIGDLGRAFNAMTASLRDVTASRDELEREIRARRLAEDEKRSLEHRFRELFESSLDGIAETDLQGHFIQVNAAFERLTGFSREDLVHGLSFRDLTPPEYVERETALVRETKQTGKAAEFEKEYLRKDGTRVPILCTIFCIRATDGSLTGLGAIVKDITDRRVAEQKLAETLDLNQKMIAASALGIAAYRATGPCVLANRALAHMVGGTVESVQRQDFRRIDAWKSCGMLAMAEEVLSRGESQGGEVHIVSSFGREVWLDCYMAAFYSGGEQHLLLMASDISGRKQAELALREQRERFLTLLDSIPEILYVSDPHAHEVLFANRALQRKLGHDPVGGLCYRELHGRSSPCDFCTNDRILSRREALTWTHRHAVFGRTYRVTDQIIKWPDGRDVRFEMAVDTTEQEVSQERLRRALAEIARSNQDLQEFAYAASHDLQEPLRKVSAFGDRLRERCASLLPPEGADYLARILNATSRMQRLIDNLLLFSRVNSRARPFSKVDLNTTLREAVSDLEARLSETGGRVDGSALPVIEAEETQMRQLFQNLVGNALKFHKPQTPPQVRVRASEVSAPDAEGRAWVEITVEDDGIGFDPRFADRIFKVFQRLHAPGEYEGTGIGLAICRRIAERHGGSISAEGRPGEGARFRVRLPVRQAVSAAGGAEMEGAPAGKRVGGEEQS